MLKPKKIEGKSKCADCMANEFLFHCIKSISDCNIIVSGYLLN